VTVESGISRILSFSPPIEDKRDNNALNEERDKGGKKSKIL
jgi:hypothetical protein